MHASLTLSLPQEAELVMFSAVRDLLAKTGLKPKQIDVLGEGGRVLGRGAALTCSQAPTDSLRGEDIGSDGTNRSRGSVR